MNKSELMDNIVENIKEKDFKKLYSEIYVLLTKNNQLKNYSTNNAGIRFKLNNFDIETLTKIDEMINMYTEPEDDVFSEHSLKDNKGKTKVIRKVKNNKSKNDGICWSDL